MRAGFTRKIMSIRTICSRFKMTPQGYYKSQRREIKEVIEESIILELIKEFRNELPVEGYHKLYKRMKSKLEELGIKMGRDKLFKILKVNGLLVKRKKRYATTTNSNHRFYIHKNLILDLETTRPNEVYVSDITYVRVSKGFMYLSLITDLYSRKIVGYNLSKSLGIEGCLIALKQSLRQRTKKNESLIHHSDRGFQYCSNVYTNLLKKNNVRISMAAKGNCYENAVAERVNGILKQEFGLSQTFTDEQTAQKCVDQGIRKYNEIRLHMGINYDTPSKRHVA